MRMKHTTPEEQLRLITECHESGMTNYEWCKQHSIKISTFYSWVHRLKQSGEIDIPTTIATVMENNLSKQQDIVKIRIEDENQLSAGYSSSELGTLPQRINQQAYAVMEVTIQDVQLRVTNEVDPRLLAETIRLLRGAEC